MIIFPCPQLPGYFGCATGGGEAHIACASTGEAKQAGAGTNGGFDV
jgi:uncharacterized spore protein YtfJ